ncbi:MAG: CHASE3 domain-containing protein [Bacteroidetes bacterium]|nr:CHASE3 domain-containing protein [Bacteroidota bacterium]
MFKLPVSKLVFAFLFLTFFFILIFYSITYQSVKTTIESSHADSLNLVVMRNLEGLLDDIQELEVSQRGFILTKDSAHLKAFRNSYEECIIHINELNNLQIKEGHGDKQDNHLAKSIPILTKMLDDYTSYLERSMNFKLSGRSKEALELSQSEAGINKILELRNYIKKLENDGREFLRISAMAQEANSNHADKLFRTFGLIVLIALLLLYFRITFDLKKRNELEKRLQTFNEELSKHVHQKTAELREKNDQLDLFLEHSPQPGHV